MHRDAVIDIYKGKNPGDVPVYSISEAPHYLRLPVATIRSWAIGRRYPTQAGPPPSTRSSISPTRFAAIFLSRTSVNSTCWARSDVPTRSIASGPQGDRVPPQTVQVEPSPARKADAHGWKRPVHRAVRAPRERFPAGPDGDEKKMDVYLKPIEWDRSGVPIRLFRSPRQLRDRPKSSPSTRRSDSVSRASGGREYPRRSSWSVTRLATR